MHKGRHDPGAEFGGATGRVDAEAEALDEIDAASNQSLVPSSFGMTFCVDGDVETIELEARWGRYQRDYDTEIYKTRRNPDTGEEEQGPRAKVWQRVPCGGKIAIHLREGPVPHRAPDSSQPEIRVQGTVRAKNANGDRLVTLFLVNAQKVPEENKDSAWIFQPELILRAPDGRDRQGRLPTQARPPREFRRPRARYARNDLSQTGGIRGRSRRRRPRRNP